LRETIPVSSGVAAVRAASMPKRRSLGKVLNIMILMSVLVGIELFARMCVTVMLLSREFNVCEE
jgi:hypothetical protein